MSASTQANTQATRNSKQCDLCQGEQFETVGTLDRHGKPLESVVCCQCGLIAHAVIPTEEELAAYYAKDYRQDYHGESIPSARRVMRAWKNGESIQQRLEPFVARQSRVFEVGAGIGCTVKAFQRAGHRASGIEPNEGFQGFSRDSLRSTVSNDFLYNLPATPQHDLVLLVHVIEHFCSPRRAMEHLHKIIQPEGLLYVECPNIGAPFATHNRLFHYAHIHNFTPATLATMARATGFEVVQWFSKPESPALEVLLKRTDHAELSIDPNSYRQSIAALERYNWLTYHARATYWQRRLTQLSNYAKEHLVAKRFVAELLQELQQEAPNQQQEQKRAA